jgi:hypothetical protein
MGQLQWEHVGIAFQHNLDTDLGGEVTTKLLAPFSYPPFSPGKSLAHFPSSLS